MTELYYDRKAGELAVTFFEKLLVQVKGEWAGRPFELMDWQKEEIIRPLFGWKRAGPGGAPSRRFRRAYIEVPRKQGKSTIGAGIALYLLLADNEPGVEVYSAAADRMQAGIVFELAKTMVESSKALSRFGIPRRNYIEVPKLNGMYRCLSADVKTKHGLNSHGIVFDELHAQPNRDLWDVLNTSTGARRQPLMVMITTAGYDRNSICWEQHEYARQVLAGVVEDDSFFGYIAAAEEGDDWTDPVVWAKANPGLGTTVKLEYLEQEANRAQQVPAYQNTFRRLHLNQWTQQESRFIEMAAWDGCDQALPDLSGRVCYAGLDLASTTDIAALGLIFPPVEEDEPYWWLPRFWIPAENMIERSRRDRVPYEVWVRLGLITATAGNVIDYGVILKEIEALGEVYEIREIAFDRWGATQISQALAGLGFEMVQFGQGFASMASPTRELIRLVLSKGIGHGGHPVLRWMADNVSAKQDAAGNTKLDKAASREKIDGIVAGVMGLARAVAHDPQNGRSIYEDRGILQV